MYIKKYITALFLAFFVVGCTTTSTSVQTASFPIKCPTYTIGNVSYVPLDFILSNFNVDYNWDSIAKKLVLSGGGKEIAMCLDSDVALVDGSSIEMDDPLRMKNGIIAIPESFAVSTFPTVFTYRSKASDYAVNKAKTPGEYALARVVIDAGHGGKDPGAMGQGNAIEKHITLDISQRLARYLEDSDIEVVMTRDDDRFISLWSRSAVANKQEADFFISVHANASPSKYANGFEVYYLSEAVDDNARAIAAAENASLKYEDSSFGNEKPSDALEATLWDITNTENRVESIEMANYITKSAQRNVEIKNRGIKSARFYVLKGAKMPSVLVEVGFVSNPKESNSLKNVAYRDKLAHAIAQGIIDYKNKYERTEGFTKK